MASSREDAPRQQIRLVAMLSDGQNVDSGFQMCFVVPKQSRPSLMFDPRAKRLIVLTAFAASGCAIDGVHNPTARAEMKANF